VPIAISAEQRALQASIRGSLGGEGLGVAETAVLLTEAGRAAAGSDTDVAAYWLAAEAPAAMRACHHLHGGTGMDVSYPLHAYSALVKDLVTLVGGADYRLGLLGDGAG
jgi:alkylation response protein AidB-like acyl-CoA dehydrogenase